MNQSGFFRCGILQQGPKRLVEVNWMSLLSFNVDTQHVLRHIFQTFTKIGVLFLITDPSTVPKFVFLLENVHTDDMSLNYAN